MMAADRLSQTFAALADPTRREILTRLLSGEASVTELANPFDMSLPAVSKHLKVLEQAGLIERGREKQWRPCRLKVEPLKEASACVTAGTTLAWPLDESMRLICIVAVPAAPGWAMPGRIAASILPPGR